MLSIIFWSTVLFIKIQLVRGNLDEQLEAIEIGAHIILFISNAPMARIKNLVSTKKYELHSNTREFSKNALYKRPGNQMHNWKCNNDVCVIISEYSHK